MQYNTKFFIANKNGNRFKGIFKKKFSRTKGGLIALSHSSQTTHLNEQVLLYDLIINILIFHRSRRTAKKAL